MLSSGFIVPSPDHRSPNHDRHRSNLAGILALTVILVFSPGDVLGQLAQNRSNARSSKLESRLREAERLLSQGHTGEAIQSLREFLILDSSSVEGYDLLGIAYGNEKNYVDALEAFQHALKLNPNSIETHNNLGNLLVAQNKLVPAENEFRKVLRLDPTNRDANYNLGLLLMTKGAPGLAIIHFQHVHPANLESRLNLIRAYLRADRAAEGLKAARELSAERENDIQLHFTLGVLLGSEKQYRSAELELEKANALQPETFEILYNLGQSYLRSGEYAQAEVALNRALKLKPDSAETLYLVGQVYSNQMRAVDALDVLARAHKLAPEDTDIIVLLARVSMSQHYFEDAIPLLQSGLKIAPQRAALHAALGESYLMSGKVEKAIEEFEVLVAIDPSPRSYAFMGLCYRHLGRFAEAKKYFEEGLKRDPHNASCLFNLGYIEGRQGKYERAEDLFRQTLRSNPDFSEALLELANLRIATKKLDEAAELLRKYIKVSRDPAPGYYRLAMVERRLHQVDAAARDLNVFHTLSKNSSTGPRPYQYLLDYLDGRSNLSPEARTQLDLTALTEQVQRHPGQPQDLCLLAKAYLKLGRVEEARKAIDQLDLLSADDYVMQTAVGVLFAENALYDDAIRHFQTALRANPESDDVKFDLADAYFHQGSYAEALQAVEQVSASGRRDDALLALLGDIHAHLGHAAQALEIFRNAISQNPDNDQYYLSLMLVQLRANDIGEAENTLRKGLARIPASGKIQWGLGIVSAMEGKTAQAAEHLDRAVDLLPEWSGSYAILGLLYYKTGQIEKAREVLNRFKESKAGGLDVERIGEALDRAPAGSDAVRGPISMIARQQLLQLALSIADTL